MENKIEMSDSILAGIIGVLGTVIGSVLTFTLNGISSYFSRRREKKEKEKQEKKHIRERSIEIVDALSEAYFINYEIRSHFSECYLSADSFDFDLNSYIGIIARTQPYGNLPKKIKIQKKYKKDVLMCSGVDAYNQFTMIDAKINSALESANHYKTEYLKLFKELPGKKKIEDGYTSIMLTKEDFEFFEKNSEKIDALVKYIATSISFSDKNIDYLLSLIETFINGKNFPIENFKITFQKNDGEITIERKNNIKIPFHKKICNRITHLFSTLTP